MQDGRSQGLRPSKVRGTDPGKCSGRQRQRQSLSTLLGTRLQVHSYPGIVTCIENRAQDLTRSYVRQRLPTTHAEVWREMNPSTIRSEYELVMKEKP